MNDYLRKMERRIQKWDLRFLRLAEHVASWSKDPSTKCGAVIVRPDFSVVSLGYNGFPRGCDDAPRLYGNREEKYQRVIHAEVNAVLQARCDLSGCILYSWPAGLAPTCDRCATVVIQAGITRVVHGFVDNEFTRRWSPERSLQLYREAGVQVVSYPLEEIPDD